VSSRLLWSAVALGSVVLLAATGLVAWRVLEAVLRPPPVVPSPSPSATLAAITPSPVPVPLPTPARVVSSPEVARVVPTPAPMATLEKQARTPAPTRVAVASPAARPSRAPVVPAQPQPSAPAAPSAEMAAARTAWEAVARVADDGSRPEAERMAELRRYLADAPASPYRAEAASRLTRLEEDFRRRLLAPPDPSTLGRQRRATYVGGTLHNVPEGSAGTVAFPDRDRMVLLTGSRVTVVPFRGVSSIEYGLTDHIRGMLFKKKSHYLSLTYRDAAGDSQGMVLELSGDEFRPVLTQLEARTGQKVQYQDEKAARERWK
jgi:hypothetical protein